MLRQWQMDGKLASFSRPIAACGETSAVKLDEAPSQRKSNSQSAGNGFERRLGLIKQIKQMFQTFFGNPDAIVPDRNNRMVTLTANLDPDLAVVRGILRSVTQQVCKHLCEPHTISIQSQSLLRHYCFQVKVAHNHGRPCCVYCICKAIRQVELFFPQLELIERKAGNI